MVGDSSSMGEHWEEITVRFDCYVSCFEKISNIVLSLIWFSFWKLYISYDLSVDKLGLFNKFVSNFWLPLFIITTALRLGYWIPRILGEAPSYVSDHSGLIYWRRRLERFGFYIERIAILLLPAPYFDRAIVFQFGCCAIPCLVIFPLANSFQLALWASSHCLDETTILSNNRFSSGRITEQDFMLMFLKNIFGLNDGDKNGELKKTHASTDSPAHRLDLNDDDNKNNNNNNNIPDIVESEDAGETVESEDSGETEESKVAGETVESKVAGETVESKDGGETEESESESESDKAVLSGSEEGSFVMLELNKDEEELQDSSSVESREEQTETILEGKLGNNEEKLETKMCDLKKTLQKTAEKSEKSFGELICKLRATESQAELYRLQAQENKENLRKLEEERTGLIHKLAAAANASFELYHALLHDLE